MKTKLAVCVVAIAVAGAALGISELGKAAEGFKKRYVVVGVYDSRAVMVAYANSEQWQLITGAKMKEMEAAKAAGNKEKVEELEQWGSDHQKAFHLMGFGTEPVQELLEPVKDKLPEAARQAGVDVIVSQWQIDYLGADAETVDVTDPLVRLFNPTEKTLKTIEELRKHEPLSREVIEKHPD